MSNLQEAFREAARREFATVPDENELDYTFSPGFQRKMQRIIRAQVHGYWNMVNTLGKRIAIAAAIIVMLLTTAMAIKPIRERVIQFFVRVYEDYFEVSFGEKTENDMNPTPEPMVRYTLTKLPTGYIEDQFLEYEHLLWTSWKTPDGLGITLQQEQGTQAVVFDNNGGYPNHIIHNDLDLYYLECDSAMGFVWSQYGNLFSLTVYESMSIHEILDIVDSLEKY